VEWQQRLRAAGVKTAILSNMGEAVRRAIEQKCAWVHALDVRVWSHDLHCTKPDPQIYDAVLAELGINPGQALFLDDREENVEAARRCGINALVYSGMEQLRDDLRASSALSGLPPV
jgi:putative hydrolase of the HAD superfamily